MHYCIILNPFFLLFSENLMHISDGFFYGKISFISNYKIFRIMSTTFKKTQWLLWTWKPERSQVQKIFVFLIHINRKPQIISWNAYSVHMTWAMNLLFIQLVCCCLVVSLTFAHQNVSFVCSFNTVFNKQQYYDPLKCNTPFTLTSHSCVFMCSYITIWQSSSNKLPYFLLRGVMNHLSLIC